MSAGEILLYPSFPYPDGGTPTDKLLIVLNEPKAGEPYLVVKTTKQQKDKIDKHGCSFDKGYYLFKKQDDFFREDNTWVLFDPIIPVHPADFLNWFRKKGVTSQSHLKPNNVTALINCIKLCQDVIKYHRSLL